MRIRREQSKNSRRFAARLAALLAVAMLTSSATLAAPDTGTGENCAAKYTTTFSDGSVTITNNFGAADLIEMTLDSAPLSSNAVYTFYLPSSGGKATQLGTITIRKGTLTGKLNVPAGKLSDYQPSSEITMMDGTTYPLSYGPAGKTTALPTGAVTLRNNDGAAATLMVERDHVVKGMTLTAIVNGRLYKGTARADKVDLQLTLAKGLEIGTPVWYTVAAPSCPDIGYSELVLGDVEESAKIEANKLKVFFQGDGTRTTSIVVTNLNPGDTVRCYNTSDIQLKSATVPSGGGVAILTALTVKEGDTLRLRLTEKGKTESDALGITVPAEIASPALKSSDVSAVNQKDENGGAVATITVKNMAAGDTAYLYNIKGALLGSLSVNVPVPLTEPLDEGGGAAPRTATATDKWNVEFKTDASGSGSLGTSATTVYVSVERDGGAESAWLSVKVPAAK